jgi:primosomal protein N' (replication factor Y)
LPPSPRYRVATGGDLPERDEIMLLGPAEAPIALIRGRYRYRLLARGPKNADMQAFLRDLLATAPKAQGGVRVQIDVDPQSFL